MYMHESSLQVVCQLEICQFLVNFCRIFIQNIYLPLPWQRVCVRMKGMLIAWFCVTISNQRTIGPVNAHLKLPMLLFRH